MTNASTDQSPGQQPRVPALGPYELWMVAQGALGTVGVGGLLFLVPAYVLDQEGTPADAGAVMALIGGVALAGPFLGGLADRYSIHRAIQLTSILLLGGGALSFAFAEQVLLWLVAAALVGLGMAGLIVVNATFVVGAGFDGETQARKLALPQSPP
jgi:MFS family permease